MHRRIFIAGEQGQVAQALARSHSAVGDIVMRAGRKSVDITDREAVADAVARFQPDLVVNAAAYTAVDRAESEVDQAFAVNRDGAANVAAAARSVNAPIIHISTDYVFDGTKPAPYVETDTPSPIGVYGKSKLAGEAAVVDANEAHVILRTSWVYGTDGNNFLKTMLRLAGEREEIAVVDDQWGAPTFAFDLADAIVHIGTTLVSGASSKTFGTYHIANSGSTTWCGFARAIMAQSALQGGPACRVRAIATGEFPTVAARPKNSRLDCSALLHTFGIMLPAWRHSVITCVKELVPGRTNDR